MDFMGKWKSVTSNKVENPQALLPLDTNLYGNLDKNSPS